VPRLPVHKLRTNANELNLGSAKVYHLPDWHSLSHPERLVVMRQIAAMRGRDPRIAKLALKIIRSSGAQPRQYEKQAAALLKWVQDPKNCYYVNEPGERLQDPIYTLRVKHGDCDDMVLLLCSLFESVNLPWKQVLSGRGHNGEKIRYIEGQPIPPAKAWAHIYCMVGTPPFQPNRWYFCEPTVQGVPLGWDVIDGDHRFLPEMAKRKRGGRQVVMPSPTAPRWHKPAKLPPPNKQSPAYAMAYGAIPNSSVSSAIGASIATEMEDRKKGAVNWQAIGLAVFTGVAVSVGTQLTLDWIRGKGMWEGRGTIGQRWGLTAPRTPPHMG
jgi:hypothetical protein